MEKRVLFILLLMSVCVTGIIGLQLFWNYQNYQTTIREFGHDTNEALTKAVARETDERQNQIVKRFEGWLADTSLITITADHNNRDSTTAFYVKDTHPKFKEDQKRKFQFGLTDFKERLNHITPQAKALLIAHFGVKMLKPDLEKGYVYYYTQMLGDSLEKAFNSSKVNLPALQKLFKQELAAQGIHAEFSLNPARKNGLYLTKPVNTHFKKPYKNDAVYAGFDSPNIYFFKEMKWVLITTLLLIAITVGCFTYTVKTLLSQQKLAVLKDAFVNNMTHELNTPISSIKITAEALKSFKHTPENQAAYLDIISYQAGKLSDLTGQILNTSQLIHTHKNGWTTIDLNELITVAIHDLQPQIEQLDARISYQPNSLTVKGDSSGLLKVLINLIDNALKYTAGEPKVTINLIGTENYAEIRIADNGPGILAEYREQIFEQFFRVPQGNLHNVKGFGLGLSYVRQVISQHRGAVFVNSNQPCGCVFTIKLPLNHA